MLIVASSWNFGICDWRILANEKQICNDSGIVGVGITAHTTTFNMGIISNILGAINRFFFWLGTPFRVLTNRIQQARAMNPVRTLRAQNPLYGIRGFFSRIWFNLTQIPRVLRLPPLPNPIKSVFRPFGFFKKTETTRKIEGDQNNYVSYKRRRRRARWQDLDLPPVSQIHLVHQGNQKRTVLHIGFKSGKSATEVLLADGGHPPVRLRFRQVNPQQYRAEVLMAHVAGQADVFADGKAVIGIEVPIQHGTRVTVEGQTYACELHGESSADLPNVTRVLAGWFTSTGPRRANNEDAIGIYQHADAYMFVIADGVGGGEAGELISEFAVRYLLAAFHRNVAYNFPWEDVLRRAVERINDEVWHFTQRNGLGKAGTTLTAVVIQQWDAHVVHLGDSRLYHLQNRTLQQVTQDHVTREVEEVTRFQEGMPEQSQLVLSRAIGKADTVNPDWYTLRLQPGDKLLLCTDGISEALPGETLLDAMINYRPDVGSARLVELANVRDGRDNASAVMIDVLSHAYDWDGWRAVTGGRVYAGYAPVRPLRIEKRNEHLTRYVVRKPSPRAILNVIFWIVIIILVVLLVLFPPARSSAMALQDVLMTVIAP